MRTTWRKEAKGWLKTLLLTVAVALAVRAAVVEAYVVPTGSMLPTIREGDHLLGAKYHYWLFAPQRGDIVVFRPPDAARELGSGASRYVKRVLAVGGDEVSVRDGVLRVNGERVEEPYLEEAPRYTVARVKVPEDHLFVLGDNRNESHDSHRWGFVRADHLVAHVFARYWPLNRFGGLR